jgi:hypothetical protein
MSGSGIFRCNITDAFSTIGENPSTYIKNDRKRFMYTLSSKADYLEAGLFLSSSGRAAQTSGYTVLGFKRLVWQWP